MRPLAFGSRVLSLLIAAALGAALLSAGMAFAQATSTEETTTTETASSSATTTEPTAPPAPEEPAAAAPALPLQLVRVIGTKYVDYCTNGKTTIASPSDAAIAANLDKPDAPTPTCPNGMTWDHTSGMDLYDTASGDLSVNEYAQLADGTYIVHFPASVYTDATSTAQLPARILIVPRDPSIVTSGQGDTALSASTSETGAASDATTTGQ